MRGSMKFFSRSKMYKASNVTYNPETGEAVSYDWWTFVKVIGGKVVFNNHNYSSSTCKHQAKVRSLLRELGVTVDVIVNAGSGLHSPHWQTQAVGHVIDKINAVKDQLRNPRRRKSLDEDRTTTLNELTKELDNLQAFIAGIQEAA